MVAPRPLSVPGLAGAASPTTAGSGRGAHALLTGAGVTGALLLVKLAAKFAGAPPAATAFKLPGRERA